MGMTRRPGKGVDMSGNGVDVQVHNATSRRIPHLRIQKLVARLLSLLGFKKASVGVRFVSPQVIQALNRRYRRKSKPPTILTFIYTSGKAPEGDIVLCPQAIAKEAKERGVVPEVFLLQLVAHGLLHLKGFHHETHVRRRAMERLERRLMSRFSRRFLSSVLFP